MTEIADRFSYLADDATGQAVIRYCIDHHRWLTVEAVKGSIDAVLPRANRPEDRVLPNHTALSGPVKGLEPIEQWRTGALQACVRFLRTGYGKTFEDTGFPWTADECHQELQARGVQA